MRSFQGHKDSVIFRDVDSQSYEENAHEVLLLVVECSLPDARSCEEIRLSRRGSEGVLGIILTGVRAP